MTTRDQIPYLVASPLYFDKPEKIDDNDSIFEIDTPVSAELWTVKTEGLHTVYRSTRSKIPEQGWKIHVSSTDNNCQSILRSVSKYCILNDIYFKFLRSVSVLRLYNSKYWDRSASGKFITIYPSDEENFANILEDLSEELLRQEGPYILSDIRHRSGPLFARYGAFLGMSCADENGNIVAAIRHPSGSLVPDNRGVTFSFPEFVQLPAILSSMRDDLGSEANFPYEFLYPIQHSNSGGVYVAKRLLTNERLVVREARPHTAVNKSGQDSVARLEIEYRALLRTKHLTCTPNACELFKIWEHSYLAMEEIAGNTLLSEIVFRYPFVNLQKGNKEVNEYAKWCEDIYGKLKSALDKIHASGVFGLDIHPSNIIITPQGTVVFVDFENAKVDTSEKFDRVAAQGFVAPEHLSAHEADRFALACTLLMMLMPFAAITGLAASKRATLIAEAALQFPTAINAVSELENILAVESEPREKDAACRFFEDKENSSEDIEKRLVESLLKQAIMQRDDILFPCDPQQFRDGGATFAYGAAGVLYALHKAGAAIPSEMVDWLGEAANRKEFWGRGAYDGPHGIAYVLWNLGKSEVALDILDRSKSDYCARNLTLFGGESGIGLNWLHFSKLLNCEAMLTRATEIGDHIVERLTHERPERAGLFHGGAGIALFLLRLYEVSKNRKYLEMCESLLRWEVGRGTILSDGSFHIKVGEKYLAYLDGGAIGIGLVLNEFQKKKYSVEFEKILESIDRTCSIPFVLQPGLLQGRAGMVAYLARRGSPKLFDQACAQLRRLGLHAIAHQDILKFPGSGLSRFTCDLATGTAGILLAVRSINDKNATALPYF